MAFGEAAVVELHAAKGAEIKCSISNPRLIWCKTLYSAQVHIQNTDIMWYIYIYIDIRVHLVQFCRLSRHVQTVQVCASNVYLYLLLITVYFCAHLELFSFTSIHSRYSTVQNWCAPKQPYLLYEGRTVSGSCKRSKESKKLQIKIKLHQTSVYIFDLLAPKSSTTRPWKIRKPP